MSPPKKNGGYEAGKLASDIAYIKAGIIDLNDKMDDFAIWQRGVETRLATGAEAFAGLRQSAEDAKEDKRLTNKRIDDVLKESRWTSAIAGALAILAGAIGLRPMK